MQCRICVRLGHLAQRCFYRYDCESPTSMSTSRFNSPQPSYGSYTTEQGVAVDSAQYSAIRRPPHSGLEVARYNQVPSKQLHG